MLPSFIDSFLVCCGCKTKQDKEADLLNDDKDEYENQVFFMNSAPNTLNYTGVLTKLLYLLCN